MANLQTFPVSAVGGLDLVSPPQVLAQKPGFATELNNYEVLVEGGYRKIDGFTEYGDIPDVIDEDDVRGIAYYKGIVVVVGERVLHSPNNGSTWNVVNRKGVSKTPSKDLNDKDILPRTGVSYVEFSKVTVGNSEVLVITDDVEATAMLTIEGDNYTYTVGPEELKGYKFTTRYQDHIVYANTRDKPGSVVVSDRFAPLTVTGTGAWEAQVGDEIMGLHTFRDYLYIFCRSSIYRVVNLESASNVAIRPVTTKVGCIDGRSIQEIGGDILFLADEGLRYLGATERIDDVDINLVSSLIQPLVTKVTPSQGPVSSVVIPSKSQYRLFFADNLGKRQGIIGTLGTDGVFAWSTTDDMFVEALTLTTEGEGESVYHIGSPTVGSKRVYHHSKGITFDGTPFSGRWATTDFNFGDSSIRKSLHFLDAYLEAEDKASIDVTVSLDHEELSTLQPEPFNIAPVVIASRWGESVWGGETTWGATRYPADEVFLEGSGKWVKFTFEDNQDDNSPYIIRGFDIQFTVAGRI